MSEPGVTRSNAYRHYVLSLLSVILLFNLSDRVALGLLLQNIKADLHLTDTQLGLLGGISFALFYSVVGIPIARWADRGNRVTIITIAATLWSFAVALCGMVGSFTQLLLVRVVVAVGEAGCNPPALSLLADYFNRAERPRAAAIYGLGGALSTFVGLFFAGWLNGLYGWRITFVLLGAPGLALAVLANLTLAEPRLTSKASDSTLSAVQLDLTKTVKALWANLTFRHLLLCQSVMLFFYCGVLQWQPTFLIRSYGLSTGELGISLALTWGLSCILGTYLGGEFSSRYAAQNERLQLRAMSIAVGVSGVLSVFVYLSKNLYVTFGLVGASFLTLTTVNGPLYATIQTLVPGRMRAIAFALVFLISNLFGMGLGPLLVGVLSDSFLPWTGAESLRYALLAMAPGYLWGAWHAWQASRTVYADLANGFAGEGESSDGVVLNHIEKSDLGVPSSGRA